MENEKGLHSKTGVHHHDLALPGHQDKDKMPAVPALNAMWFSQTKTRLHVLLRAGSPCPQDNRKQRQTNPQKQDRLCHTAPLHHS